MHVELATAGALVAAVAAAQFWLRRSSRDGGGTAPTGGGRRPSASEPDPFTELYRRTDPDAGAGTRCDNCGAHNDRGVDYCWDCLEPL